MRLTSHRSPRLPADIPLIGLNPHSDTPVEILHVVLLGFLKYFWRDAISRLTDTNKEVLIARLDSFVTSGLGIPRISGKTLVQYCRSLTGRDFRVISQSAPFVLHGLDLPEACLDAWVALSTLVPLLWQPEIDDVDKHLVSESPLLRLLLMEKENNRSSSRRQLTSSLYVLRVGHLGGSINQNFTSSSTFLITFEVSDPQLSSPQKHLSHSMR